MELGFFYKRTDNPIIDEVLISSIGIKSEVAHERKTDHILRTIRLWKNNHC